MDHLETWQLECCESPELKRWLRWVKKAEGLAGHSLDGDEIEGDSYSLDSAYEAFLAGNSAEAYVRSIQKGGGLQ